jgi:hypothetical protein
VSFPLTSELAGKNEDKGTTALTAHTDRSTRPASDETPDDDRILSIEIGGKTVGANLEAAIAAGHVIRRPGGKLEFGDVGANQTYIPNNGRFEPDCVFLNSFMFTHIYGKKAVPIGCRDCYKVKVSPDTLRQLMAVKAIAQNYPCRAKSGSEVDRPENQSLYATYFFLLGLDKAKAVYRKLRGEIDTHPKLGLSVKMVIKRGCTNYEHKCGPSDRYTFDPRLTRIEEYFRSRYVRKKPERGFRRKYLDAMNLLEMVRKAYRIGDDTYKDFTGGKDLFPPTVTYDPDDPSAEGDQA